MKILITGGAGYIGSHTLVEVLQAGHELLVVDSLVNGHAAAIARVGQLTNTQVPLEVGDIRDKAFLKRVFAAFAPDALQLSRRTPSSTSLGSRPSASPSKIRSRITTSTSVVRRSSLR